MTDQDRNKLEKQFHQAMVEVYDRAKSEAKYPANRFIQMVQEKGGYETAIYLLGESSVSEEFTQLALRQRLDLTVESLIQQTEWRSLFSEDQLSIAAQRLLPSKG